MGSDRGEYRPIRRVLLDGPDFQQLSERARWVFVALKLNLGPTGIEVHYRDAVAHQLAAQTGAPADGVAAALDELEAAGWIRREENVLWIVGQLTHDPHMDHRDNKHRTSVWRHLQGLPRVEVVGEFVRHHAEWFTPGEYTNAKGETRPIDAAPAPLRDHLARPSEGPSMALARPSGAPTTDNRGPKTDNKDHNHTSVVLDPEQPGGASLVTEDDPTDRWLADQRVRAEFDKRLRAFIWLGDAPPEMFPDHTAEDDWKIFGKLAREHGVPETLGAMHYFRKASGFLDAITMRWFFRPGRRDIINDAIHAWRKSRMKNDRNEFERTLGDLFQSVGASHAA